jgi:hypothetical protein
VARQLVQLTYPLCAGFRLHDFLLLNDSFTEDSLQEYAVIKIEKLTSLSATLLKVQGTQVDSITVSWCSQARLKAILRQVLSGNDVDMGRVTLFLDINPLHRCGLCI